MVRALLDSFATICVYLEFCWSSNGEVGVEEIPYELNRIYVYVCVRVRVCVCALLAAMHLHGPARPARPCGPHLEGTTARRNTWI